MISISAKETIKSALSPALLQNAKVALQRISVARSGAKTAFNHAPASPEWLSIEDLRAIEQQNPVRDESEVNEEYREDSLQLRAKHRLDLIKRMLGEKYNECAQIVETGSADAMVALALQQDGKHVTATDIYADGIDDRAVKANVRFEVCGAENLPMKDNSVDLLYSFDSFEHFQDPESAFSEAIRVIRPGGFLYLRFGPLYFSPDGMHLGSRLNVPYASVLFHKQTIDQRMREKGLDPINHTYCNGWNLDQYRSLFKRYESSMQKNKYFEHWDLSGLDLISRYPSCFKSKSSNIESFFVGVIDAVFEKR